MSDKVKYLFSAKKSFSTTVILSAKLEIFLINSSNFFVDNEGIAIIILLIIFSLLMVINSLNEIIFTPSINLFLNLCTLSSTK